MRPVRATGGRPSHFGAGFVVLREGQGPEMERVQGED